MIEPFSLVGFAVLGIFLLGMTLIMFEAQLEMDKFKPALFMMTGLAIIGMHYYFNDRPGSRHLHMRSTRPRPSSLR